MTFDVNIIHDPFASVNSPRYTSLQVSQGHVGMYRSVLGDSSGE